MNEQVTIIIPEEKPISWNKLYSGNLHWSGRRKEADRVHMIVRAYLNPDWPIFEKPVDITMTVYFQNKRLQLDASNIAVKLYEDGLIGWLIKDDSPEFVRSVKTASALDRKNPRVVLTISEVENE